MVGQPAKYLHLPYYWYYLAVVIEEGRLVEYVCTHVCFKSANVRYHEAGTLTGPVDPRKTNFSDRRAEHEVESVIESSPQSRL